MTIAGFADDQDGPAYYCGAEDCCEGVDYPDCMATLIEPPGGVIPLSAPSHYSDGQGCSSPFYATD